MCRAYSRKLDVLNRGFGGYNTIWAEHLFDQIFAKKEDAAHVPVVRMVTIWFGTNDSVLPSKEQYTPIDVFVSIMDKFLENLTSPSSPYAVASTPVSIILITPGPMLFSLMGGGKPTFRSMERTKEFVDAVLSIGQRWKGIEGRQNTSGWKIATVNLWDAMVRDAGGMGEELAPYLTDGLHFSSKGYGVLWREIERVVKTDFRGRGLDFDDITDLPFRVPWWQFVDRAHPETAATRMTQPKFRRGDGHVDWSNPGFQ